MCFLHVSDQSKYIVTLTVQRYGTVTINQPNESFSDYQELDFWHSQVLPKWLFECKCQLWSRHQTSWTIIWTETYFVIQTLNIEAAFKYLLATCYDCDF